MRNIALTAMALVCAGAFSAYGIEAFRLYDNTGRQIAFEEMVDSLGRAEVVFIGENHNCPISHWMELEITKAMHEKHGDSLVIGEEMMEADNQLILDEYMSGKISYDRFETEARLWPNYSTDYYPVVYYAKENGIPFVATNVPRRYANAVSNGGLEVLESFSPEALTYIAPLPIPFEYNTEDADAKFGMMQMLSRRTPEEMRNLAEAQALKDATMGWMIAKAMKPGSHFVHINGTMHSNSNDGIIPYLKKYRPSTRIATVTSIREDEIDSLDPDYLGMADFYILVPTDFPMSY